jgi:hypothetical protein
MIDTRATRTAFLMERLEDEAGGLGLLLIGGVIAIIAWMAGWGLVTLVASAIAAIGAYFAFDRHRKSRLGL